MKNPFATDEQAYHSAYKIYQAQLEDLVSLMDQKATIDRSIRILKSQVENSKKIMKNSRKILRRTVDDIFE